MSVGLIPHVFARREGEIEPDESLDKTGVDAAVGRRHRQSPPRIPIAVEVCSQEPSSSLLCPVVAHTGPRPGSSACSALCSGSQESSTGVAEIRSLPRFRKMVPHRRQNWALRSLENLRPEGRPKMKASWIAGPGECRGCG